MSSSNCCFLTCIQISQEAGQVVWYSHLFQNFPQLILIRIVKGFDIVNKAEIDVFLELSCFFLEGSCYSVRWPVTQQITVLCSWVLPIFLWDFWSLPFDSYEILILMRFWYIGIVAIYLWYMLQIISSSPPFIIWFCLYCFLGFPGGSAVKILPAMQVAAGDVDSIPGLGRSPGRGHGNPLQYSCLGNPMDRGAWRAMPIGSQRVGHEWSNLAHTYCFLPGKRFLVYFIK